MLCLFNVSPTNSFYLRFWKTRCVSVFSFGLHSMIELASSFIDACLLPLNVSFLTPEFQSHIFKHISEVIDPLARVYPRSSLTNYLEQLVQRTIQCPNLPNHNILSGCVRSVLMEDSTSRRVLVPPIITNLKKLFSTNLDIVRFR